MSLTREEKEKLLRALEEDRELRYALMGLLGYKEVLERIARLEERFAQLEERFARLEERYQKLEERFAGVEKRLAEHDAGLRQFDALVKAVAHRFGVISEEAFREAVRFIVEETLGAARVERLVLHDREGVVYGHEAVVEVDLVVRDGVHVLVKVKSRVSRGDVAELARIGLLYQRFRGVKPRLVIVGALIDENAWETARRLGVEIRPITQG